MLDLIIGGEEYGVTNHTFGARTPESKDIHGSIIKSQVYWDGMVKPCTAIIIRDFTRSGLIVNINICFACIGSFGGVMDRHPLCFTGSVDFFECDVA